MRLPGWALALLGQLQRIDDVKATQDAQAITLLNHGVRLDQLRADVDAIPEGGGGGGGSGAVLLQWHCSSFDSAGKPLALFPPGHCAAFSGGDVLDASGMSAPVLPGGLYLPQGGTLSGLRASATAIGTSSLMSARVRLCAGPTVISGSPTDPTVTLKVDGGEEAQPAAYPWGGADAVNTLDLSALQERFRWLYCVVDNQWSGGGSAGTLSVTAWYTPPA